MRTLLAAACLMAACADEPVAPARGGQPVVCAVNYPLAYLAERIAGDSVEVLRPFPADGERPDDAAPSEYEPDAAPSRQFGRGAPPRGGRLRN